MNSDDSLFIIESLTFYQICENSRGSNFTKELTDTNAICVPNPLILSTITLTLYKHSTQQQLPNYEHFAKLTMATRLPGKHAYVEKLKQMRE